MYDCIKYIIFLYFLNVLDVDSGRSYFLGRSHTKPIPSNVCFDK